MAYTIPKHQVLSYAPEALRSFSVYGFEWIDNLHFLADPTDFIADGVEAFIQVANEMFAEAGWAGNGDIRLMWLPSFAFPLALGIPPKGIVLWHVKQQEDGVSFILSPIELPFEEFRHKAD
ncbi:hypothetical protein J7373_16425 [Xanthomonas sp. A2111]|uniref:Uncharacterized protein n=1 Tax=Xanthomonas hawaiiensis TaxID=3003247 RepID=A0ABU2I5W6_9XANT|nr:hypothetical protein [Xanthomonas sp. A2111]MBO9829840.1 hypothetical protein [Xanthomonas sp. A2111]MDS9993531.1 hypothetical protein [Xanthomonas sp. A2111]